MKPQRVPLEMVAPDPATSLLPTKGIWGTSPGHPYLRWDGCHHWSGYCGIVPEEDESE